ncbi:MAG TPA: hypothetical protein VLA19_14975, partial [Herpetosiphonaceae bacterium]|nr:hypothetical protein [Herpetosiphonaceae bacterium]
MPAQERLRLDDEERLPPRSDAARQEHQERPVGGSAVGALDAAPQDEELLSQQGVLGEQLRLAAWQIRQGPDEWASQRRLCGGQRATKETG